MASDLSFELALPLAPREREPEFLARAVAGDHEAYANLVRPYERVAYRVAAADHRTAVRTRRRRCRTAS